MATSYNSNENSRSPATLTVKFNKTAMNILLPLLISTGVFITEIYCIYHFQKSSLTVTEFLHLLNTCFVPTHIATSTCFLYDFYSTSKQTFYDSKNNPFNMEVIKKEKAGFTTGFTIGLGFVYVLCNVDVYLESQIVLVVFQCIYMLYLCKYGVGSKVVEYRNQVSIRDVLSGAPP